MEQAPDVLSASQPPQIVDSTENSDLTPLRAHYLKKVLIQLQFLRELDAITTSAPNNVSTLSYLGAPFTPPPQGAPFIDLPFLRYIFRQFVLTFPFMTAAPKDFYSDKLQPFMASVLARNLSPKSVFELDAEHTERATRQKLLEKLERNLSLFMASAIRISSPEEVVRLTQADLDRLKEAHMKKQAAVLKENDIFEVNIVCVRTVVDKGRVRSRAHEVTYFGHLPMPSLTFVLGICHSHSSISPPRLLCVSSIWRLQNFGE